MMFPTAQHPLLIQRKPRKASYVPAHPWHLEALYAAKLRNRIGKPLGRVAWQELKPVVARYLAPSERMDAPAGVDDMILAIGKARIRFGQTVDVDKQAEKAISEVAPQVEAFTLGEQAKMLRTLGVDAVGQNLFLATARAEWTRANVNLIRTIPDDFFARLSRDIISAVHEGQRHETLARTIRQKCIGIEGQESLPAWRYNLIARDQVSKYNGALAHAQQSAVGIEKYEWRSVNDRRTRETHLALDHSIQSWDNPPAIGHPGEPIQCRCSAIAIL